VLAISLKERSGDAVVSYTLWVILKTAIENQSYNNKQRSAPDEDHHRAVAAAIRKPPSDWKRPPGRPNHTWLRATESDLRPVITGPSYAWKKAASREHWRSTVDMATLKKSMPWTWREIFYRAHRSVRLALLLPNYPLGAGLQPNV